MIFNDGYLDTIRYNILDTHVHSIVHKALDSTRVELNPSAIQGIPSRLS